MSWTQSVSNPQRVLRSVMASDGRELAMVFPLATDEEFALLCAAPDLLEALRRMEGAWQECEDCGSVHVEARAIMHRPLIDALSAIAKAEGGR